MKVSQAIATRRSIRDFLDKPVDRAIIARILERAQRSPSGGNVQPWHGLVLTGEPLQKLFKVAARELTKGRDGVKPEFAIYPPEVEDPYKARIGKVGEDMYGALGIPREDKQARLGWFKRNFEAFGAPALMLVHTPQYMGLPQWGDIGMWLQSIMLLAREEGIDTCPQESWANYAGAFREVVAIPKDHILYCGIAFGYRNPDAEVNAFPVDRASLDDVIRWDGWE